MRFLQGGLNPRSGCKDSLRFLVHSSPAEIGREILGGHPIESGYPVFESMVVAVHVLDMEDGVFFMNVLARKDQLERNILLVDESPQRIASVDAQDVVLSEPAAQISFDGAFGLIGQDRIDNCAMSVSGHQDRNLFAGESACLGLAAAFSGRAWELAAAFEGLQEVGFIRLGGSIPKFLINKSFSKVARKIA